MISANKKIILSGGGTGGPVTPLLAVARNLVSHDSALSFIFIGTGNGPEKALVIEAATELPIVFRSVLAGKFRRYFSFKNFTDLFKIGGAFFQSLFILLKEKPVLIMSAGAFVSVPVVWAAKILSIPILIHQQDVRAGLANKLMAPFADKISVTFEDSLKDYGPKAVVTGNPFAAPAVPDQDIYQEYGLNKDKPLVLIFGGATGAAALNEAVIKNLDELLQLAQIFHLTGKGKAADIKKENYFSFEFLPYAKLLAVMAKAEVVISRAGLGAITDLSALKKPAILVPIPGSHQEDNAKACSKKEAAIYLEQSVLDEKLVDAVRDLLDSAEKRQSLSQNIQGLMKAEAAETISRLALSLIKK